MTVFNQIIEKTKTSAKAIEEKAQIYLPESSEQIRDRLNQIAEETLEQLTTKTEQIKDNSLTTIKNLNNLGEQTISQFKQDITKILTQETESLKTNTQITINNLDRATNNLTDRLTSVTEKSQESLNQTIQKVENLSNNLTENLNISLSALLENWLKEHPFLSWIFEHPILSAIAFFLFILVLFSLWQIIFELFKQIIIAILRTPWLVSKFVLLKATSKPSINNYYHEENQIKILEKLDLLERQQQTILDQLSNFKQKK